MPHRVVDELNEHDDELQRRLVEQFILKSGLDPDFKFEVVKQDVFCTLPTEEQIEEAMIDAAYYGSTQLDTLTRDPRFRRFLLAKSITRVADTEFEEGDEPLKRKFLGRLPQLIFDRVWEEWVYRRNEMIMILSGAGDVIKKSPASPSGEEDGSSSEPQDGSPSTNTPEGDSQDSTPSN
jgi:hypothetical protein